MKCFEISDEAMACECWTGEELMMMMDKLKMCTLKDEAKMVSEALVMCKDEFGKCRKFEDDSCTTIAACSQDPATLRAKALALAKNIEDLSRAKAKVQSAQSRRRKSRSRRQAGTELDCDALEAKVAESKFVKCVMFLAFYCFNFYSQQCDRGFR